MRSEGTKQNLRQEEDGDCTCAEGFHLTRNENTLTGIGGVEWHLTPDGRRKSLAQYAWAITVWRRCDSSDDHHRESNDQSSECLQ